MAKFPVSPRIGQAFLDSNTLYVWSGSQWIYINDFKIRGDLTVGVSSGPTGGNINLSQDTSGGLSGSNVNIGVYSSKIRIFEDGGDYRGVNIDISKAPAGSGGEISWKASGITSAGYIISLGDIGVQLSTSGNRSFQISTTGSSITSMHLKAVVTLTELKYVKVFQRSDFYHTFILPSSATSLGKLEKIHVNSFSRPPV